MRQFASWVATLEPRTPLTVTKVSQELGVTRHAAMKILREQQGKLLDYGTYPGGYTWKRGGDGTRRRVRQGETWFVAEGPTDPFADVVEIEWTEPPESPRTDGLDEFIPPTDVSACPPREGVDMFA